MTLWPASPYSRAKLGNLKVGTQRPGASLLEVEQVCFKWSKGHEQAANRGVTALPVYEMSELDNIAGV